MQGIAVQFFRGLFFKINSHRDRFLQEEQIQGNYSLQDLVFHGQIFLRIFRIPAGVHDQSDALTLFAAQLSDHQFLRSGRYLPVDELEIVTGDIVSQ